MSTVYVFEGIDRISDAWHSGGSVVVVTGRDYNEAWQAELQRIASEHKSNAVYLEDEVVRQTLPEPTQTYLLASETEERVFVFLDAGCC